MKSQFPQEIDHRYSVEECYVLARALHGAEFANTFYTRYECFDPAWTTSIAIKRRVDELRYKLRND